VSETKLFVLDVRADSETRAVSLRLCDDRDQILGSNDIRLDEQPPEMWEALFDTAGHVSRLEQAAPRSQTNDAPSALAAETLEKLGVFLGRHVLGPASIEALPAILEAMKREGLKGVRVDAWALAGEAEGSSGDNGKA